MQQTIQVRCKPQHRNGCPNWKLKINPRTIGMIVLTPCDYEQSIMKKCLNQYQLNTNAFRRIRCIPRGAKDTARTTQSGHRCCNVTKPRACRLTKIEPAGSPTFWNKGHRVHRDKCDVAKRYTEYLDCSRKQTNQLLVITTCRFEIF